MIREMMPVLHVLFSHSAAGTLRLALKEDGRSDQVVCLDDNFSFGPIGGDADARVQWMDGVLGTDDWGEVVVNSRRFLRQACSPEVLPVAWISRRDTLSYAGFLWWLSQLGEGPCNVMDVTDLTLPGRNGPRLAGSPGVLNHEQMLEIIDSHVRLDQEKRDNYQALWRRLAAENAPLRVIDQAGKIASAPITHFDSLLLACATTEWRKMARIVADALVFFMDADVYQTAPIVLEARLRELSEQGALEWRGELFDMPRCEIRLPIGVGET